MLVSKVWQRRGRCLVAHLGSHGPLPGAVQILGGRRCRFPWLKAEFYGFMGGYNGGYMVDIWFYDFYGRYNELISIDVFFWMVYRPTKITPGPIL